MSNNNRQSPGALPKPLQAFPPKEEIKKTEEKTPSVTSKKQKLSQQNQPSQKQTPLIIKPEHEAILEKETKNSQTNPVVDKKDGVANHDTPLEEQTQSDDSPQEVAEVVPHLKQLMTETGLRLGQLDELYNISRVSDVDLNNMTFLDQYYRYNYQVRIGILLF